MFSQKEIQLNAGNLVPQIIILIKNILKAIFGLKLKLTLLKYVKP